MPTRRPSPHYRHVLDVQAPADQLFNAISKPAGVRAWWTPLVTGTGARGKTIRLEFEGLDEHIDLRVINAQRPSEVEWEVTEHSSLGDWAGTRLRFDIEPKGRSGSRLTFQHIGLFKNLDCYDECEAGWDHFLGSLVLFVENGEGEPF